MVKYPMETGVFVSISSCIQLNPYNVKLPHNWRDLVKVGQPNGSINVRFPNHNYDSRSQYHYCKKMWNQHHFVGHANSFGGSLELIIRFAFLILLHLCPSVPWENWSIVFSLLHLEHTFCPLRPTSVFHLR